MLQLFELGANGLNACINRIVTHAKQLFGLCRLSGRRMHQPIWPDQPAGNHAAQPISAYIIDESRTNISYIGIGINKSRRLWTVLLA
jgi:hypothetical protein